MLSPSTVIGCCFSDTLATNLREQIFAKPLPIGSLSTSSIQDLLQLTSISIHTIQSFLYKKPLAPHPTESNFKAALRNKELLGAELSKRKTRLNYAMREACDPKYETTLDDQISQLSGALAELNSAFTPSPHFRSGGIDSKQL